VLAIFLTISFRISIFFLLDRIERALGAYVNNFEQFLTNLIGLYNKLRKDTITSETKNKKLFE
jgi:hypothetical protein